MDSRWGIQSGVAGKQSIKYLLMLIGRKAEALKIAKNNW